jgi:hypothetical protein
MSGKRFFRADFFASRFFKSVHWAGAGVVVVVPSIPGIEIGIGIGIQVPHYRIQNTRPHYASGWQRPHYEVKEEA